MLEPQPPLGAEDPLDLEVPLQPVGDPGDEGRLHLFGESPTPSIVRRDPDDAFGADEELDPHPQGLREAEEDAGAWGVHVPLVLGYRLGADPGALRQDPLAHASNLPRLLDPIAYGHRLFPLVYIYPRLC